MDELGSGKRLSAALALLCAAAVSAIFWPMLEGGFLELDDPFFITANPVVQAGLSARGLRLALVSAYGDLWHPLTWLSHMLACQFFGLEPRGHLAANLMLHAANAALLCYVLAASTGAPWTAAAAASFFALHPLRVESVAWIAERKDVLSGFFFFCSLAAYAGWTRRPTPQRYALLLLAFAAALMSKPIVVTLPFCLVLMDYWPLGRLEGGRATARLLREKIPLLAMSAAACALTLAAQRPHLASTNEFPWAIRLASAPVFYLQYLKNILWPVSLSIYYPHPGHSLPAAHALAAAACLAALSAAAWAMRRRLPFLWMGWLWFLLMLLPVIGLIQAFDRSIANRFTYLPQAGLCFALAWTLLEFQKRGRARAAALACACVAALAACGWAVRRELADWREPSKLYERALALAPENEKLHNSLGIRLASRGRLQEARAHFLEARRLNPKDPDVCNNLGLLSLMQGRGAEAREYFKAALLINPAHPAALGNLSRS